MGINADICLYGRVDYYGELDFSSVVERVYYG